MTFAGNFKAEIGVNRIMEVWLSFLHVLDQQEHVEKEFIASSHHPNQNSFCFDMLLTDVGLLHG